jgi:hypothetical protein
MLPKIAFFHHQTTVKIFASRDLLNGFLSGFGGMIATS